MQGLGEDVLGDVLRCSRPGHVIMLQTPNARRNVPPGRFWLAGDGDVGGALALPAGAQLASIVQLPAVESQAPLGSATAGGIHAAPQPALCVAKDVGLHVCLSISASNLWAQADLDSQFCLCMTGLE